MGLEKCYLKNVIEAGTDEAGRGCLSGPVVAAAVILPADFEHSLLNDSKQLSEKCAEKFPKRVTGVGSSKSGSRLKEEIRTKK